MRLDASIPANNWKIIELYNKIKKGELDPSPDFQRKLVWKKLHKFKFIETILLNFPFPEIYIAPGTIDIESFELQDIIVDGQQRCNAIREYIEATGVFSFSKIPIKKYSELSDDEKGQFLSYEVSIRYLKNASKDQVREIFQRINNTEYSLNKTERLNAQWGESEFICFAKQIIEEDLDLNPESLNYVIEDSNREYFIEFFHGENSIFTENDISRMLALQYMLTIIATIVEEKYFRRNDRVQFYIEEYFDEFLDASLIEENLLETLTFIDSLALEKKSYWLNKANLFTLIAELYKVDTNILDATKLSTKLYDLESMNLGYNELVRNKENIDLPSDSIKYFEYAREAVNETVAREYRGEIVSKLISESIIEK